MGGIVYPALMVTGGVIYNLLAVNLPVDIRNVSLLTKVSLVSSKSSRSPISSGPSITIGILGAAAFAVLTYKDWIVP